MEENQEVQIAEMSEDDITSILQGKFEVLSSIKQNISEMQKKAESTQIFAQKARAGKVGLFNKRQIITDVQNVMVDMAENQVENAEINRKILIYQQKQAETMKFLFGLGVSNLANNRAVIKFLKQKLEDGEQAEFDEVEEEEILSVIKQLKAQEDILEKQDQLSEKLRRQSSLLAEQGQKCKEQDERIEKLDIEMQTLKKRNMLLFIFEALTLAALAGIAMYFLSIH